MKLNELIDHYLSDRRVVNCKTKEEAEEFLSILDKEGYTWGGSGDCLTDYTSWDIYEEDTCYEDYYGDICYGSIKYYNEQGAEVISVQEFKDLIYGGKKEFKVGESFQFGLIRLKCVESDKDYPCQGCCLNCYNFERDRYVGNCNSKNRSDHTNVIFIEDSIEESDNYY